MNIIETFKCPIMDGKDEVGSMMIIRGVFPKNADPQGAKNYFKEETAKIANKEFKDGYIKFHYIDDPNYHMAIIIEGQNNIPFGQRQCD